MRLICCVHIALSLQVLLPVALTYKTLIGVPCRRSARIVKLKSVAGVIAGIALATHLQPSIVYPAPHPTTLSVAVAETKQGLYREYTVEKVDDSALDAIKRSYKTAEETDTSKNKYWTILAVLVAGSFVIPMVQYFWYVAEED